MISRYAATKSWRKGPFSTRSDFATGRLDQRCRLRTATRIGCAGRGLPRPVAAGARPEAARSPGSPGPRAGRRAACSNRSNQNAQGDTDARATSSHGLPQPAPPRIGGPDDDRRSGPAGRRTGGQGGFSARRVLPPDARRAGQRQPSRRTAAPARRAPGEHPGRRHPVGESRRQLHLPQGPGLRRLLPFRLLGQGPGRAPRRTRPGAGHPLRVPGGAHRSRPAVRRRRLDRGRPRVLRPGLRGGADRGRLAGQRRGSESGADGTAQGAGELADGSFPRHAQPGERRRREPDHRHL